MGAGSWAAFGSTALAQKILLGRVPAIAGIVMYRSMARETGSPASSVVAPPRTSCRRSRSGPSPRAGSRCSSPWPSCRSHGTGSTRAFRRRAPERPYRFAIGFGVALAIGAAFVPAVVLPVAAFVIANLVPAGAATAARCWSRLGIGAALLLAFPVVLAAAGDPGAALASDIGTNDVWALLRLAPGDGPGNLGGPRRSCRSPRSSASRAPPTRSGGARGARCSCRGRDTVLAWASVAGYLPPR
jgi:hypothetical protein